MTVLLFLRTVGDSNYFKTLMKNSAFWGSKGKVEKATLTRNATANHYVYKPCIQCVFHKSG